MSSAPAPEQNTFTSAENEQKQSAEPQNTANILQKPNSTSNTAPEESLSTAHGLEGTSLHTSKEPAHTGDDVQHAGSVTEGQSIWEDEATAGLGDLKIDGRAEAELLSTRTTRTGSQDDRPPTTEAANASASGQEAQTETAAESSANVWGEGRPSNEQPRPSRSPVPDTDFDDKQKDGEAAEARPEIDSIVQQFSDNQGQTLEHTTSPQRSELPVFSYPPRSSSLEHANDTRTPTKSRTASVSTSHSQGLAQSISSQPAPAPPDPDPEPTLPFDFHRFLEQLRHRTADPVAKFLRSFLTEFGKKQWQVHEQVKIIQDFLTFISGKMSQCEIWKNVTDAEFDNAREGMEKLVMNRLYAQTFSPEIPPQEHSPSKGRRKGTPTPGRRGQHQEDVERDQVLEQKFRIYGWIREEHLDMTPFGEKGHKFLRLAQQELQKIKAYRAPRDKIICVLNSCKVLFGFLRSSHNKDQSADAFIPLLIYTVLKASPEHLVSNVQYITRFRNQDKLSGEAGYYMSSLMGAVQFVENLDRTNLTISDKEFEANVEAAVSSFQERHQGEAAEAAEKQRPAIPASQPSAHPTFNEKASLARPEVTPRHSLEGERAGTRGSNYSSADDTNTESEDNAAVAGLLRTIQKPLSTIGRIFSEDSASMPQYGPPRPPNGQGPPITPQPGSNPRPPRTTSMQGPPQDDLQAPLQPQNVPQGQYDSGMNLSPGLPQPPGRYQQQQVGLGNQAPGVLAAANRNRLSAEEAAARRASAETARAQEVTRAEHRTVVE